MVISSYMNIFISTWVLLVAGLVFALPMIHMRVKDTTEEADEMYVFVTFFLSCLSSATALASWRSWRLRTSLLGLTVSVPVCAGCCF